MDSECCTNQTNKSQDLSQESSQHLDKAGGVEANEAKVELSLSPITPDAVKENGDFPLELSSPLTVVKKLPKMLSFDSKSKRNTDPFTDINDFGSPQTPMDGVFDPFAFGPEEMALAPQCKKYFNKVKISVARRLNFGSSCKTMVNSCYGNEECFLDEEMFESVYENLLEVIISEQTESAFVEIANVEWDSDACRTPSSAPLLSGVAETCPDAPLKPAEVSASTQPQKPWASLFLVVTLAFASLFYFNLSTFDFRRRVESMQPNYGTVVGVFLARLSRKIQE